MGELWQANSVISLYFVDWDSGYKKVVQFASAAAQDSYFAGLASAALTLSGNTYVRPNVPLVVDGPYSVIHRFNYLVVENPAQPVEDSVAEKLYYFITAAEYVSPASTRITLQLDVWQTRVIHDGCTFGAAYCERGHVAVSAAQWAENNGYEFTRRARRFMDIAEGLDIGTDYVTTVTDSIPLGTSMYTVVLSTVDLTADPGTVDNPSLTTSHGGIQDGVPSGATAYVLTTNESVYQLFGASATYSWVAQCIIGVYAVPANTVTLGTPVTLFNSVTAYVNCSAADSTFKFPLVNTAAQIGGLAATYDKLSCYPYTAIEWFSAASGASVLFKPQYFATSNQVGHVYSCIMPPFIRTVASADNYGSGDSYGTFDAAVPDYRLSRGALIQQGEWLASSVSISDYPQFPVVTSGYMAYMASTANSRAYSYQSAGWSLAASSASANNAYEAARRSLANNNANNAVQNQLTDSQQLLSVGSGALGALGNLTSLNIGGALSSAAGTGLNYLGSEAGQAASNQMFVNNQNLAARNANANQRLAEYVNEGNYQNTIAGINATVQDAQLTPPSQAGMAGGDGFAVSKGFFALLIRYKTLTRAARAVVLSYFAKYGYAVHEWVNVPANLCLMAQTTYWKLHDVTVTSATANDNEVQVIKGIFEQGVSVYDSPEKLTDSGLMSNTVSVAANYYVNQEV